MYRLLALALPLAIAACANPAAGPAAPGAAGVPLTVAAPATQLTGVVWSWQRVLVGKEPADAPEQFTIELLQGGKFTSRIDCNAGGGSWMVDEAKIRFTPIRVSKMMCPPGWKDREFSKGIEGAETWALRGGELVLTTRGEVGTMRFRPLPR